MLERSRGYLTARHPREGRQRVAGGDKSLDPGMADPRAARRSADNRRERFADAGGLLRRDHAGEDAHEAGILDARKVITPCSSPPILIAGIRRVPRSRLFGREPNSAAEHPLQSQEWPAACRLRLRCGPVGQTSDSALTAQ